MENEEQKTRVWSIIGGRMQQWRVFSLRTLERGEGVSGAAWLRVCMCMYVMYAMHVCAGVRVCVCVRCAVTEQKARTTIELRRVGK